MTESAVAIALALGGLLLNLLAIVFAFGRMRERLDALAKAQDKHEEIITGAVAKIDVAHDRSRAEYERRCEFLCGASAKDTQAWREAMRESVHELRVDVKEIRASLSHLEREVTTHGIALEMAERTSQ